MDNHRIEAYLAFAFGVVFVAAILILAVVFPNPTSTQHEIFRIVIALAAGGVGAVIHGLLNLQMNLALSSNQKLALRAGGALAVFVIVYFYSPAQVVASSSITQTVNGKCGTNATNISGSINISCK